MKTVAHPLRWLPPLVLGVCAATVAEVAVGLLLYSGPGFMRSLTTILGVEAASLALGIMNGPAPRPDLVESLRRRWLFCLIVFMCATLFSAFWSVVVAVGGTALGQGLGLALLAGLPLYTLGGVVGAMSTLEGGDAAKRGAGVGGPAVLGAAIGFAATGVSLPQVFTPASLLLVCLVLLSGGGLVYGSVLDARLRVHVRARRPSSLGDVLVEDRHFLATDSAARVLREGGYVRSWVTSGDDRPCSWDQVVWNSLLGPGPRADRALLVGGGTSTLPLTLVREGRATSVDVLERSGAVLELAREHLETGLSDGADEHLSVMVGNLDDALATLVGPYRVIFLDSAALDPVGGLASLSVWARKCMGELLETDGFLALGPHAPAPGTWSFPEGWSCARYRSALPRDLTSLGMSIPEEEEVHVGSPAPSQPWPSEMGPFTRVEVTVP